MNTTTTATDATTTAIAVGDMKRGDKFSLSFGRALIAFIVKEPAYEHRDGSYTLLCWLNGSQYRLPVDAGAMIAVEPTRVPESVMTNFDDIS